MNALLIRSLRFCWKSPTFIIAAAIRKNTPETIINQRYAHSHTHSDFKTDKHLILLSEKPFCAIGPIYFEYGSLVITFNTPKAATAAVLKLQNAVYEEKKLIVLCLPNVQPHMLPPDVEPLLVLVNVYCFHIIEFNKILKTRSKAVAVKDSNYSQRFVDCSTRSKFLTCLRADP